MEENFPPIYGTVIGLDVHLKQVTATALVVDQDGQTHTQVRVFETFMDDLRQMALWCQSLNPDVVCMESTGVYWMSPYWRLNELGLNVKVFNAQRVRNVPGRKTDTSDSLWLARVVRFGMVWPSFVPSPDWLDMRSHARLRQKKASDLARAKNELDKILTEAGIKLGTVVSDIHGKIARQLIECLITGGSTEDVIRLAGKRLKASPDDLRRALEGDLSEKRRVTLMIDLDDIRRLEATIAELDRTLLIMLQPYQKQLDLLQTIPGLGLIGAALLLVEIGPDMEVFKTPERLASWAGLCPGNNESAGKRYSGRTRKGNRWVRRILCEAAQAAVRTECVFQAKFKDLIRRRGYKRSIVAIAHKILRVVFAILSKGEPYKDITVDYEALMVKKNAARWIRSLKKYNLVTNSEDKGTESVKSGSVLGSTGTEQADNGATKPKRGRPSKVPPPPEVAAQ